MLTSVPVIHIDINFRDLLAKVAQEVTVHSALMLHRFILPDSCHLRIKVESTDKEVQ